MRLSVFTLLFALVAAGCATKWVHPDPDADWDAAYADCAPEAEAAGSGEIDNQVMKDCLEAKGWVELQTSNPSFLKVTDEAPSGPAVRAALAALTSRG